MLSGDFRVARFGAVGFLFVFLFCFIDIVDFVLFFSGYCCIQKKKNHGRGCCCRTQKVDEHATRSGLCSPSGGQCRWIFSQQF
jgi:hypothetical protein